MGRTKSRRKARKPVKRGPLAKARKRTKKPAHSSVTPESQAASEGPGRVMIYDHMRLHPGRCESCSSVTEDLRPFGVAGRWVCFGCMNQNKEARMVRDARFAHFAFGKPLPPGF